MASKRLKEFDYDKEKAFEEKTNHLHYPYLEQYLSSEDHPTLVIPVNDIETQKKGIDIYIAILNGDNISIELKTDKHTRSPNIFLEDVSNFENKKLGWTLKCEAKILSYGFYDFNCEKLTRLFLFDMQKLKKWFRRYFINYEPKHIRNKGYQARGRAVPIEDLKEFMLWDMNEPPKPVPKKLTVGDFF